jgi:hypothetical protein
MSLNRRALLIFAVGIGLLIPAQAQEDFLTRGEVEEVRDAQEPNKRLELYLTIAQRRIDAIKTALSAGKSGTGRAAQKSLEEYTSVLEALETTLEDGREKRAVREKDLEKAKEMETEFLTYLKSLNTENSPGYEDYHFTLDEAIVVTEEMLADVEKGAFPEVQGREPPRLPAAAPREPREAPQAQPAEEEGPPRRRRTQTAPAGDEEGPPRRSGTR